MSDPSAVPFRLTRPEALRIVKEIGANPDNIVPVSHAKTRMRQRGISITQARSIVQHGYVAEEPRLDDYGWWRVEMEGLSAGDTLRVTVAIDWRTRLLIITVF